MKERFWEGGGINCKWPDRRNAHGQATQILTLSLAQVSSKLFAGCFESVLTPSQFFLTVGDFF